MSFLYKTTSLTPSSSCVVLENTPDDVVRCTHGGVRCSDQQGSGEGHYVTQTSPVCGQHLTGKDVVIAAISPGNGLELGKL